MTLHHQKTSRFQAAWFNCFHFFLLALGVHCFACSGCEKADSKRKDTTLEFQTDPEGSLRAPYKISQEKMDSIGPRGGTVFEFEPDDFRGEWTVAKREDLVRIYIDHSKVATDLSIDYLIARADDERIWSLDQTIDPSLASKMIFELANRELTLALGQSVEIEMRVGESVYTAVIGTAKQ